MTLNSTSTRDITRHDLSEAGIHIAIISSTDLGNEEYTVLSPTGKTRVVFAAAEDVDNVGGDGVEDLGWDVAVYTLCGCTRTLDGDPDGWDQIMQEHFGTKAEVLAYVWSYVKPDGSPS